MKWQVIFTLERPNDLYNDDETWFDESHIKSELRSWLEDIDYKVHRLKVKPYLKFPKDRQDYIETEYKKGRMK